MRGPCVDRTWTVRGLWATESYLRLQSGLRATMAYPWQTVVSRETFESKW